MYKYNVRLILLNPGESHHTLQAELTERTRQNGLVLAPGQACAVIADAYRWNTATHPLESYIAGVIDRANDFIKTSESGAWLYTVERDSLTIVVSSVVGGAGGTEYVGNLIRAWASYRPNNPNRE